MRQMALALKIDDFSAAEPPARMAAIEAGLPIKMLRVVMRDYGFSIADLAGVIASRRTLERRLEEGDRLNMEESERLARLMRLLQLGREIFDEPADVKRWLSTPKRAFDKRIPLQMIRTEVGGRVVEEKLLQLKYGFFA